MAARGREQNWFFCFFLLVLGALLGSVLGELLGQYLPFLRYSVGSGFSPVTLRLANVLTFTLGISLRVNLATLAGVVLAFWFWRR